MTFDVETTGLPVKYAKVDKKSLHLWPQIVQLSWVIYDDVTNKITNVNDHIVKVKHVPEATSKIHRITTEISQNMGKSIKSVMKIFAADWEKSHIIVAHNKRFDLNLIGVESMRVFDGENIFKNSGKIEYCSMAYGYYNTDLTYMCKTRKKLIKKNPTLMELHETLFDSLPQNLHNAFIDILVCFRCTYQMIFKVDPLKNNIIIEMPIRETKNTRYVDDLDFTHVYNYYCGL